MIKPLKPLLLAALATTSFSTFAENNQCPQWLDVTVDKLHSSKTVELCDVVAEKPVLLVNTASHCGYTKQFGGLEKLHQEYKDKGLVVVGFPSDSFKQENDDEAVTASVCYENYGVSFLMSKAVPVRGDDAHPIFKHLAAEQGKPSWNFNKYLVDRNGHVVQKFGSRTKPSDKKLVSAIEQVL